MALTVTPAELTATALTLTTAAQPNITSVGTLTTLTVGGDLTIADKIIHSGDTDSFFRFAGANDIRIVAGNVEHAAFDVSTIVFNQSGADMDFRVESTGNASMLHVDAGNNRVGIGINAPARSPLHVHNATNDADSNIHLTSNETGSSSSDGFTIAVSPGGANDGSVALIQRENASMKFYTNSTQVMELDSAGKLGIGTTSPSSYYADDLVVAAPDEGGITIASSATTHRAIMAFADATSGDGRYAGSVAYDHNTDAMTLNGGGAGTAMMQIDSAGHVTMPLQPAFLVAPSTAQNNIDINADRTIEFGTEIFDIGSNFASHVFTAPVTGKYQFNINLRLNNVDSAADYYTTYLITSNRAYYALEDPGQYNGDIDYKTYNFSVLADLDASDTAYVRFYQSGGTAQTDTAYESGGTTFSGYLVA